MLHTDFIKHLEATCSQLEHKSVQLRAYETVPGGDTHQAYRLAMTDKDYFIKVSQALDLTIFEKEALGLKMLSETSGFVVPDVYDCGIFDKSAYILMPYIQSMHGVENPENFAQNLVKLHHNTSTEYGLASDNYIGKLPQKNTFNGDWIDFFWHNRLKFQLDLAGDTIPLDLRKQFDRLSQKLPDILVPEKPALVHGDLWQGNYFYNLQGQAVVFDPAVYFGHREVDMAMMSLFGGFSLEVYHIYQALFPMQPDWKNRLKIYQLYPLLVHVNLFGAAYLESIRQVLNFFVKPK